MLPIFRVKSNTVYTFDDFFNDLIKKFPIVKDYGFCKVYVIDREVEDVTDLTKLNSYRFEWNETSIKPPELESGASSNATPGIYNFDQKVTQKGVHFKTFKEANKANFLESSIDITNPREYIDSFWHSEGLKKSQYAFSWNGTIFNEKIKKLNLSDVKNPLEPKYRRNRVQGVNRSMLLAGGKQSTFQWHTEDHNLASILYLHLGGDKYLVLILPESRAEFEARLKADFAPYEKQRCANPIKHKRYMTDLAWLDKNRIKYSIVRQEVGSYMIILPGTYHSGYNVELNLAEGMNFVCRVWSKEYAENYVPCDCGEQRLMVEIDVEEFKCTDELSIEMVTESYDVHISHPIDNTTGNEATQSFTEEDLSFAAEAKVEAGLDASHEPFLTIEDELNGMKFNPHNDSIDPLLDSENAEEHEEDELKDDVSINDDRAEANAEIVFAETIEQPTKKKREHRQKDHISVRIVAKYSSFFPASNGISNNTTVKET